jgi:hypothetical protein
MRYGSYPSECGTFTYGEVEDYSLNIIGEDLIAPEVTQVSPSNLSTNVEVNSEVSAEFSEAIDPGTISSTTFSVTNGAENVAGLISYEAATRTAIFTPSSALGYDTTYTATLTVGIADAAGNTLASDYLWQFSTEPDPALIPPSIVTTSPDANQVNVQLSQAVNVYFSKDMEPNTINVDTITVSDGSGSIDGIVSYENGSKNAVFTPSSDLEYDTTYTVTASGTIQDTYGNALGADYSWSFTTVPYQLSYCTSRGLNTYYMRIGSVKFNNYTFVYNGGSVNGYRDETLLKTMNLSRYSWLNLTLTPAYPSTAYTVYWKVWVDWNQDGIFAESEAVYSSSGNTAVTGTISTPEDALGGNTRIRIAMKYGSYPTSCESFSYGEVADYTVNVPLLIDTTPPTVTGISPSADASGVSPACSVSAVFSEALDPSTISQSSFLVSDGINPVSGVVAYDNSTKTVTFTPGASLAFDTTYSATITTQVTDTSGNAITEDYTWSFTTHPETLPVYGLSGQITYDGSGLENVVVTLGGDQSMTTTTDVDGYYAFSDLPQGNFTVTPTYAGYVFSPSSATDEIVDQDVAEIDFTAQEGGGTITWGFDSGSLSGFTAYETANGDATFGVYYYHDLSGGTQQSYAAYLQVGCVTYTGDYVGGGLSRNITLTDGSLHVTIDTLASSNSSNADGGFYEVFFDGDLVDSFNVGDITPDAEIYHQLAFDLANVQAGQHEIKIQVTRKYLKSYITNYIDNIVFSGSSVVQ